MKCIPLPETIEKETAMSSAMERVRPLIVAQSSVGIITEDALRQVGVKRLHRKRDNLFTFVDLAEYEVRCQRARRLLISCEGYFYGPDYDDLKLALAGEQMASSSLFDKIERRAREFRAAGIPPIFSAACLGRTVIDLAANKNRAEPIQIESSFPVVDFVVQFATGALRRKQVATAMVRKDKRRDGSVGFIPIPSADIRDVIDFRSIAFTPDGRIDPILIREVIDHASKKFTFRDEAQKNRLLQADQLIYLILEEFLHSMEVPPRRFVNWNGNVEVINQRCWYLDYDDATRKQIIDAFVAALPGIPKGKDRRTFQFLAYLFPGEVSGRMDELVAREQTVADAVIVDAMAHAAATHDYRFVPEVVFVQEPYKSRYRSLIANHFRTMARQLGKTNPDILFGSAHDLGKDLKVPGRLPVVPEFKAILDDERLKTVTAMTDRDFVSCFVSDGRRMSIGHAKFRMEAQVSRFMRRYINRRYKRLVP